VERLFRVDLLPAVPVRQLQQLRRRRLRADHEEEAKGWQGPADVGSVAGTFFVCAEIDVMIKICGSCWRKNCFFFLKNQFYDKILEKTSCSLSKKRQSFRQYFKNNIFPWTISFLIVAFINQKCHT
jgi:hypothetical protein